MVFVLSKPSEIRRMSIQYDPDVTVNVNSHHVHLLLFKTNMFTLISREQRQAVSATMPDETIS